MKTKHIFLVTVAFIWTLFSVSSTYAAAVIPLSSGIKNQFYSLEWCSPHYNRLTSGWSTTCRLGYFQNIGGVARVVYNGQDFPTGNVGANGDIANLLATRTDKNINSMPPIVNFFASVTDGAFAIQGEGVLTIRTYITDYSDNTSFYKLIYKVDKTAPQLSFSNITESNDYTYYGGRVNTSTTVTKNDSVGDASNADLYINPEIALYSGDSALPRASHTRPNLHSFYFRDTLTGLGTNNPFTANTSHSDSYGGHLQASGTSPLSGWYNGVLVSWEKHFQLLTSDGIPIWNGTDLSVGLSTANLINNTENTQKYYRLRLYDTTVDPGNGVDSGNYSETAFYVVRDNTTPNMGGNGLAGTDTNKAIEDLLTFPDSDTVYDKTTTSYSPQNNGFSRFLAATLAQSMNYKLSDIGVTGNGSNTGNGCTDYNLCNAGLDTTNLAVKIEDANDPANFPTFTTFPNRFVNAGSNTKHFNKVDNHLVSNGTYRKYSTQFQSNNINGVCDLVGNCFTPNLAFRVVANTLSDTTSNISLASMTSGKMMANGTDSYKLSYALKDAYGNKVVPVKAMENGDLQIKTVDTVAHFQNGLNVDQRSKTPTGVKLVHASDEESDNGTSFTSDINGAGTIAMQEGVNGTGPNGVYAMKINSEVPTKGFYPYISDSSILRVAFTVNSATVPGSVNITYPKTGDRIGSFIAKTSNGWTSNDFITPNTGNLSETASFAGFNFTESDYGKITLSNNINVPFTAFTSRRANLEFASPFVYGLDGMTMGSLTNGTPITHTKKLFVMDNTATDPRIYEKILVAYTGTGKDQQPGILDFNIRKGPSDPDTLINKGACYGNASCIGFDMFLTGGKPVHKSLSFSSNPSVQITMSPIESMKPYIDSDIHRGFVSALTYSPDGSNTVLLPSIARDINDHLNGYLDQYQMARYYFSDDYNLGYSASRVQDMAAVLNDIAITGLSNRYNGITTSTGGNKANVNVGAELTRFNLVTSIKKNVVLLSAGFQPSTDTSGKKKWCAGTTINQSFIDASAGPVLDCTQTINGETISFIDGDATLYCWLNTNCSTNKKRSIIVKNGSLYVKSNITNLDTSGIQTDGQLFLGVMNEDRLSNVTVDASAPNIVGGDKKGWLFIDPSITNIDAFLFSQGPMVSYSDSSTGSQFYSKSSGLSDRQLRNQLHIMGSLLTLNTIGEAQVPKCPYIVENCTDDIAPIFDLINFRNFKFTSLSTYTALPADNDIMTPQHPDGNNTAKVSGGKSEEKEPEWDSTVTCGTSLGINKNAWFSDLRCITDRDYRPYPMLIERDLRWNSSPSALFKITN